MAKEIAWGPTINLKKGSCYWINALVPAPARSPSSDDPAYAYSRSFSSPL